MDLVYPALACDQFVFPIFFSQYFLRLFKIRDFIFQLSPELPKWRLNRKSNEFDKSFEVNQTYPKLFNKKTSKQRLDFDTRKESNFSITNDTIHDLSSLYYHDLEYSDEEFKDLNPYAAILMLQSCDETSGIERGNFLVNHYLAYSTSEIQTMTLSQLIAENHEGNLVDIWTKNKLKMKMKLEKVLRNQKLFVILQPIIVKEVVVLVSNIDLTIKSFEAKVDNEVEAEAGARGAEDNLLFEDDKLLGQPLDTILPQIDIENTLGSKVSNFLIQSSIEKFSMNFFLGACGVQNIGPNCRPSGFSCRCHHQKEAATGTTRIQP